MRKLGWPPFLWLFFFITAPIALVTVTSFLNRGTYGGIEWTFQINNLLRVFDLSYFKILLESLKLAMLTTLACLALGLPMAWAICTCSGRTRIAFMVAVSIPFFMNLIIRIYALRILAAYDGIVVKTLTSLGFTVDPFAFSQNQVLVFYGMVSSYLPFMIFPLYAGLEKFDFTMVEAARDLGANSIATLFKVIVPNIRPAIASGCIMVFVPAMGEFVIPDLLGGAKNMLVGNLITDQFLKSRDWPFGSALSVVLMFILTVASILFLKWGNRAEKSL
jgi:spermidine/putrescine transport system permease protein